MRGHTPRTRGQRVRRILIGSRSRGSWRKGVQQEARENLLWEGVLRVFARILG